MLPGVLSICGHWHCYKAAHSLRVLPQGGNGAVDPSLKGQKFEINTAHCPAAEQPSQHNSRLSGDGTQS